jgi:hypothetical protein
VADRAFALQKQGQVQMTLDIPDVLKPFKDAFLQLLAPKKLLEVSTRQQVIYYEIDGKKLQTDTLSSGEREVVNIAFDFILRGPSDCIIIFDEPELHLHPELSYKLLQTLSAIGQRNQFLFCTHSPEIISASLENTVVFVRQPQGDQNQAIVIHQDDDTHHALQALGQSIGVISLGKKLVLIEGQEASLDKQTYGAILKNRFPEFVLVPAGGKDTIRSFADLQDKVLNRTIWGVDFFLLCDRDAANTLGKDNIAAATGQRIKLLPRYHLENYFLDEHVIARIFNDMEPEGSWLRDPDQIKKRMIELAKTVLPYAVALNVSGQMRERVGNISVVPKGADAAKDERELVELIRGKLIAEVGRVKAGLDEGFVQALISDEYRRLNEALVADDPIWKSDIPGRIVLHKFASAANIQAGRLKQLYLSHADAATFVDIVEIFDGFRTGGNG